MIRDELLAIQVGAPASEQRRGARMVQPDVVQHGDPGEPEKVRPEIVVVRGIADLVDRQVVRPLPVPPDELVRRTRAGRAIHERLVDEHVDLVALSQGWQELRAADGDAGPGRRHRAEPREARHPSILRHGDPPSPTLRRAGTQSGCRSAAEVAGTVTTRPTPTTASIGPAWPLACDSMRSLKGRGGAGLRESSRPGRPARCPASAGRHLEHCGEKRSEAEHRQRSA